MTDRKTLKRIHHAADIDEARERLGEGAETLRLDQSEGVDDVGEELAEAYVENVTGAADAAMEHREGETPDEAGGPFVDTSAASELAPGTDASNPPGAEREALPTVSSAPPR